MTGNSQDGGGVSERTTVSLRNLESDLESDLEDAEERYERALDAAEEAKEREAEASDTDDSAPDPEAAREAVEKASSRARRAHRDVKELEGSLALVRSKIQDWGGAEFIIKRLGWPETLGARDEVSRASYSRDENTGQARGMFRTGMYEAKVTAMAVVSGPPDSPPTVEHEDVPPVIGNWLWERVDEFNTAGEVGLSDFSLEEALEERNRERVEASPTRQ